MSEFNEYNWKMALTKVYSRSIIDSEYRALCLSDPRAAVAQVSNIELPADAKLKFFDKRSDFVYAFLLPPVPAGQAEAEPMQRLIEWSTLCTDYTTTITNPNT